MKIQKIQRLFEQCEFNVSEDYLDRGGVYTEAQNCAIRIRPYPAHQLESDITQEQKNELFYVSVDIFPFNDEKSWISNIDLELISQKNQKFSAKTNKRGQTWFKDIPKGENYKIQVTPSLVKQSFNQSRILYNKLLKLSNIFVTQRTGNPIGKIGWIGVLMFVISLTFIFWLSFNDTGNFSPEGKKVIASLLEGEMAQKYLKQKHSDFKIILEDPPPNVYAFSSLQPSITALAFGAGWITTRETLLGKNDITLSQQLLPPSSNSWLETEWKHYFALGNWTLLLFIVSDLSHDKTVFLAYPEKMKNILAQLRKILVQLKAEFEAQPEIDGTAKEVIFQLEQIEPLLKKLPTEQINNEKLNSHLEQLKKFLLNP